jgi:effector-binding domain-containing protein
MFPSSFQLHAPLQACAVASLVLILCAAALAQGNAATDSRSIIAKIDEARGAPSTPVASLAIEGTFGVILEGVNDGKPAVQGKLREIYSGEKLARHTSDMGEHGLMEKGSTEDFVWDLDPMTGAKVYAEGPTDRARRYFALMRGVSPGALYGDVASAGTQTVDGREHLVFRMTPKVEKAGKADTWFVDPKTWLVGRIDIGLPAPEGAELVWNVGDDIDAQITFADWKRVDGVQHPHRRSMKMGTATVASVITKIEPNAKIDASLFVPPEAVTKAKGKAALKTPKAGSRPAYEIVDREAQPVASIRLKCRPAEIAATMAVIYPEIMGHLNASSAKIAGPPFSRYHSVTADEIDLEAGLPVTKPIEEAGRVKNGELPAGKTVVAWHIGPYEKLKPAHEALQAWGAAQHLKSRGGPWEIYWTDPGVVPDPSKWRTQLFLPVE